ncbi:MAG: AEC family transporter [Thermodesulfobacteriota bacterium]
MDILLSVIPVFLLIALGAVLRRYGFLNQGFIDSANSLVYYILLPALLINELSAAEFRSAFSGTLVIGAYAAILLTFGLAFTLARALGIGPSETGSFVQGTVRANFAYVGLPIVFNVMGQAGLSKAGILLGFGVIWLNALSILALILPHGLGKEKGIETALRILRQVATNPTILACTAGIAFSVLSLPVPAIARKTMSLMAAATLPLSLLCLGGSFSLARARRGFGLAALAALLKLVVVTGLALAFYRWMGVGGDDLRVGVILLGCPTAVVTYVLASQLMGDIDLAGTIVITSTAASAFTITGWLFLLRAMGW